jgi:hypothetical protein
VLPLILLVGFLLAGTSGCKLRSVNEPRPTNNLKADSVGFWRNVRTYQLVNGASCVDLIDSSHFRSRYTLLFQRYRWVDEASRPAAAELALRWLLAEPTAPDQVSLIKEIQVLGGKLEVWTQVDWVGLHLEIDPAYALKAIDQLLAHLSAPRWSGNLFFQVRDEMAARRAILATNEHAIRQLKMEGLLWPDKHSPSATFGTYTELMDLRPENVKSAFRSLWFGCPKAHVYSAPNPPDFDLLYALLERVPHRFVHDCPIPKATGLDSVLTFLPDTLHFPELWGIAYLQQTFQHEVDSMRLMMPGLWAYAFENELKADLCRKRSLTCQISVDLNQTPRGFIAMRVVLPAPNATLERLSSTVTNWFRSDGMPYERWINLLERYRFDWYLARSSPEERHSTLADAAGNESIVQELALPYCLHKLKWPDFQTFHRQIVKQFKWLYVGQAQALKPESVARFQTIWSE